MKKILKSQTPFVIAFLAFLLIFILASCQNREDTPASDTSEDAAITPPVLVSVDTAPTKSSNQKNRLALVDEYLASISSANIAFNSPQTLNLNETTQIKLLLSLKKSIEELQREISSSSPGSTDGASIKVVNRMEARLTGNNFQITAITSEEQAIGENETVEWRWQIKPLSTGFHNLHLTLTAIFEIDGSATRRSLRTFDKSIEVEVTTSQIVSSFIEKNWQ